MRIKLILFISLLIILSSAFGQSDSLNHSNNRFQYFNQVLAGGFIGDKDAGASLSMSTFHGLRNEKMGAGLGLSYDNYGLWTVMPIMATYYIDVVKLKENSFYVQLAGGYSKIWRKTVDSDYKVYTIKDGQTLQASLGYRVKSEKIKLYFTAGFRSQKINYDEIPRWWIHIYTVSPTEVKRTINGVFFQIGLGI